MRKTAITIIFSLAAVALQAQSAYDALMFSENNYEGTARSVAMGNAFTALGGDLGAVTINPAGSAVAGYSQITITPSLTFTANTAQGVSPYPDGSLPYFQRAMKSRMTTFDLPNVGVTYNWDTGRKSGFKNITFGFVVNQTNSWNEDIYANGTNSTTSFMGALATDATNNNNIVFHQITSNTSISILEIIHQFNVNVNGNEFELFLFFVIFFLSYIEK